MRRILFASAAVIAIALAAPFAGAQYPETMPATPPPVETQMSDDDYAAQEQMTPQTTQAPVTNPDPTLQAAPTTPTPDYSTQAQTDANMQSDPVQSAQTEPDPSLQTDQTMQAQTEPAYGAPTMQSAATAPMSPDAQTIPVDLAETAEMAGMQSVAMSPAEVCAPRSLDLTASSSRLNRDARRHLINATDHASVCELQRITIQSPDGRGAAVRQTLVAQGVDDSLIEVERADGAGLGVEMAFSGLATSSEQYAAIFNPVQTAAYAPNPSAPQDPSMSNEEGAALYEPTSYAPDTATAQPIAYQPNETPVDAPVEDPIY